MGKHRNNPGTENYPEAFELWVFDRTGWWEDAKTHHMGRHNAKLESDEDFFTRDVLYSDLGDGAKVTVLRENYPTRWASVAR